MRHRNLHGVIAGSNGLCRKTIALISKHNGKLFLGKQLRIVNCHSIVLQRHRRRLKAEPLQIRHALLGPCRRIVSVLHAAAFRIPSLQPGASFLRHPDVGPRNLKNSSHTDADGSPVQRIRAFGCQKNRVHIECCRRSHHGPDIGRILDVLQNRDPPCMPAHLLHRRKGPSAKRTENPARQMISGQSAQSVKLCRINRHMVRQALQTPENLFSFRPGISPLHKEGKRLIARRQCTLHNSPAFSDKNTMLRLVIVLQLVFIQLCVRIQLRQSKIRNLPDLNHVFHLKAIAKARQSCRASLPVKNIAAICAAAAFARAQPAISRFTAAPCGLLRTFLHRFQAVPA